MMYEFKSVAAAQEILETFPRSVGAEKYYISGIQIYFSEYKLCPGCGEKFKSKRKDQIYCIGKCRNRVAARRYRSRKKNGGEGVI